jgi:hypothetical protein
MHIGSRTKGTRPHGWAMLKVTSDDTPSRHGGGHSVLRARWHRYTGRVSYTSAAVPGRSRCPGGSPSPRPGGASEEDHQLATLLGLARVAGADGDPTVAATLHGVADKLTEQDGRAFEALAAGLCDRAMHICAARWAIPRLRPLTGTGARSAKPMPWP